MVQQDTLSPANQNETYYDTVRPKTGGFVNKVIDVLSGVLKMAVRFAFVLKQPINRGK